MQIKEKLITWHHLKPQKTTMPKLKSEREYEEGMERIEELNPLITDDMSPDDKLMIEFSILVDLAEEYEDEHYPIGTPSAEDIRLLKKQEEESNTNKTEIVYA